MSRSQPEWLQRLREAASTAGDRVELQSGVRTYALLPVPVPDLGFMNVYGTDITAEKVVERFPNQNPNPVFRVDEDGTLIYANAASRPLIDAFGMKVGDRWPDEIRSRAAGCSGRKSPAAVPEMIELVAGVRTYALRPVRIAEFGFINVYGTDITAEKVVAKFPGPEPKPGAAHVARGRADLRQHCQPADSRSARPARRRGHAGGTRRAALRLMDGDAPDRRSNHGRRAGSSSCCRSPSPSSTS